MADDDLPFELFTDLASETRCQILVTLNKEPMRLNQLAKKLDLSIQDAHRNTDRLEESGLVQKNSDATLSLTEFGTLVTQQLTYLQFVSQHKQFFEDHTLQTIPEKFVQRIGALKNSKYITSVAEVLEKLKKIESATKHHLKIMVTQAWADEGKNLYKLIKNNVTVHTIIGKNTIFPDELIESVITQLDKLSSRENLVQREIDKVTVAIYMADNWCAVMFPNKKGDVDMSSMFLGNDDDLMEWCNDIFEYYWKHSKPSSPISKKS